MKKRVESKYSVATQHYRDDSYTISRKQIPDGPADLAFELIRQWGRTSLMPDPVHPTERDAVSWVLMPPEALITRAFDVAEMFLAECQKRGMVLELDYTETPEEK